MRGLQPAYTDAELHTLIRGMPDERLRENYKHAATHPGTDPRSWDKLLLAEIVRRGLAAERSS